MQGLSSYSQDGQTKRMFYHSFALTSYLKYKIQGIRPVLSLFIGNEERMMCTGSDFRDKPRSTGSGATCVAQLLPELFLMPFFAFSIKGSDGFPRAVKRGVT